jgi:hypothetical protein
VKNDKRMNKKEKKRKTSQSLETFIINYRNGRDMEADIERYLEAKCSNTNSSNISSFNSSSSCSIIVNCDEIEDSCNKKSTLITKATCKRQQKQPKVATITKKSNYLITQFYKDFVEAREKKILDDSSSPQKIQKFLL